MDHNKVAVRVETNHYLAKIRAASGAHLANRISEASNQQAELFRIVCDLFGIGRGDGPPSSISPDQFAAFLKSKVETICQELSPFLETLD